MVRISAIYPSREGSRFDFDYYRGSHTALAKRLLGPYGLREIRTLEGVRALDGGLAPYCAISEMVFSSFADFQRAMTEQGQVLFADLSNYTDLNPILQVSELVCDKS